MKDGQNIVGHLALDGTPITEEMLPMIEELQQLHHVLLTTKRPPRTIEVDKEELLKMVGEEQERELKRLAKLSRQRNKEEAAQNTQPFPFAKEIHFTFPEEPNAETETYR